MSSTKIRLTLQLLQHYSDKHSYVYYKNSILKQFAICSDLEGHQQVKVVRNIQGTGYYKEI
jgi:hypothetical protein